MIQDNIGTPVTFHVQLLPDIDLKNEHRLRSDSKRSLTDNEWHSRHQQTKAIIHKWRIISQL